MIEKEALFVQTVTTRLVETFLQELYKDEYKEVFQLHFSCVVRSVISSFSATMIHQYCETVVKGNEDYRASFVHMLESVLNNVMLTMDIKDNKHTNVKREVH